jgi:hypothetical protein
MYKPRLWMDNTQYSSARQLAGAVLKLRNIFIGKGQWPEILSPAFFPNFFYLFLDLVQMEWIHEITWDKIRMPLPNKFGFLRGNSHL